ncbi:MAG: DNA adenine methylase [Methanoregula sp. PtaU1.Bin051]|nr:MAG: DNA adenine methylase [Methanoregula sp. PtaU1.Bin051]
MARQNKSVPDARPFLKWAGGKTQLLREFSRRFPPGLKTGKIKKYVEPFIGGGAVFFYLNQRFSFERCTICDANEELILSYRVIRRSVKKLIAELEDLEDRYLSKNDQKRELFYYNVRDSFNRNKTKIDYRRYSGDWIVRAAQMIFLNRTCYNGLFRVNRKGEFNVPFGRYANPEILHEDNLKDVATLLKTTQILSGDFTQCRDLADKRTFVYLDPPYRPLKGTASFTSYSKQGFSDKDQRRLADFFRELDRTGAQLMLSNSDPRNERPDDTFLEDLYEGYWIERVPARRIINCNGARRGAINELVITNYRPVKT